MEDYKKTDNTLFEQYHKWVRKEIKLPLYMEFLDSIDKNSKETHKEFLKEVKDLLNKDNREVTRLEERASRVKVSLLRNDNLKVGRFLKVYRSYIFTDLLDAYAWMIVNDYAFLQRIRFCIRCNKIFTSFEGKSLYCKKSCRDSESNKTYYNKKTIEKMAAENIDYEKIGKIFDISSRRVKLILEGKEAVRKEQVLKSKSPVNQKGRSENQPLNYYYY